MAAAIVVYEAILRISHGEALELLDVGIGIIGRFDSRLDCRFPLPVYKVSLETHLMALDMDAAHHNTDVITMAGVLVGLIIVRVGHIFNADLNILDPIVAILVSCCLLLKPPTT